MLTALAPAALAASSAKSAARLTVSPITIDLRLKPGEVATEEVVLTLRGAASTVSFEHADIGFDEQFQTVAVPDSADETTAFSTRGWFSNPGPIRMRANEVRSVPLTITVPRNATSGMHVGAALFATSPTSAGGQIATRVQTGPVIFIDVPGGAETRPRITSLDIPRAHRGGTIPVRARVTARGDSFLRVTPIISTTRRGELIARDRRKARFLVPDRVRTVQSTIAVGKELGRVRVRVTMVDVRGASTTATANVWVIPQWARFVALGMLVAVALILVSGWMLRRHRSSPTIKPSTMDEFQDDLDDDLDDELDLP